MFYIVEILLITVKIVLSPWIGKWLDPLLAWKAKKIKILPAVALAGWLTLYDGSNSGKRLSQDQDHSGADCQLFSQKMPDKEDTLFSDCTLSSPFMNRQSREQHMACISPSPAAALGTSRALFLLLHSSVVVQHIFSSLRYCSCFITVKIEPRNVIIDLYVRYHYEQENKWFSASASIGLTKIVAWVNFLPPSSQR